MDRDKLAAEGYFAIIPEWVLFHPELSAQAKVLYGVLRRKADHNTLVAWPSRRTLAKLLRCSLSTVIRTVAELEAAGALTKQQRTSRAGGPDTCLYQLRHTPPQPAGVTHLTRGGVMGDTRGGVMGDTQSIASDPEPSSCAGAQSGTRRGRPLDPLWDAVMAACHINQAELTDRARGAANKAVAELRKVAAEPREVRRRAARYRQKWEKLPSPSALASQWPMLLDPQAQAEVVAPRPCRWDDTKDYCYTHHCPRSEHPEGGTPNESKP